MIVSCPECNGKVSNTVPACPHCGYKMTPPDPDSVEALDAPPARVPCPYCAEPILLAATICARCRGPVVQGKAVHPAHRPVRRPPVIVKSFIAYAVICALLYLLCWPVSLILNLMWYAEARKLHEETGVEPEGKGCLMIMIVLGAILLGLIVLAIVANGGRVALD